MPMPMLLSWRHLTDNGKVAELTHPSEANQTRAFPPPVEAADTGDST
jgi:hypothetical protein